MDRRPDAQSPSFYWDADHIQAQGSFITSESSTDQAVRVVCERRRRTCDILYSQLVDGRLNGDHESYQIASWDDVEVVSQPRDYPCARYVLRLNRVQESVTLTRSTLSTTGTCEYMTPADLVTRLATWDEDFARKGGRARILLDSLYSLGPRARNVLPNR